MKIKWPKSVWASVLLGLFLVGIFVFLVIFLGGYLFFKYWNSSVLTYMPEDGKQIFAKVDPLKCSANKCSACGPEACLQFADSCEVKVYTWIAKDWGFSQNYCDDRFKK